MTGTTALTRMRPIRLLPMLLVASGLALAGCEGVKQDLGIGVKRPPDEFAVFARAPLSMPPDYGLRPPMPGAQAESAAARESAKDVILGQGATPIAAGQAQWAPTEANASAGTVALLDHTGGLAAQPAIREQVNRETTVLADADRSFLERMMFWSDKPQEGTVVDAPEEARRIRQAQALGQPIASGAATPTIERRPKALLEGIFN
ncbi:MAG: DUF3035 domain-containing protein [Rhodospirillales bacterium]